VKVRRSGGAGLITELHARISLRYPPPPPLSSPSPCLPHLPSPPLPFTPKYDSAPTGIALHSRAHDVFGAGQPPSSRSRACRMALPTGSMHLYALTLQRSSAITAAVFGNFSGPRQQELAVARGKVIELMRPNDNGKVLTVVAAEVFGTIRSIATFRLTGGNRDYLVVGSDSGR